MYVLLNMKDNYCLNNVINICNARLPMCYKNILNFMNFHLRALHVNNEFIDEIV